MKPTKKQLELLKLIEQLPMLEIANYAALVGRSLNVVRNSIACMSRAGWISCPKSPRSSDSRVKACVITAKGTAALATYFSLGFTLSATPNSVFDLARCV